MLVNETHYTGYSGFRMLSESSFIESSILRFGVRVFYCRVRVSQTRVRARVRVFPESGFSSGPSPSTSPGFEVCHLHSPLHFVHVVSSYAALIKTPKGVKYSSNPRLCQHCLIACLSLRLQAGILSIFKSVISCNTLKKLHLI